MLNQGRWRRCLGIAGLALWLGVAASQDVMASHGQASASMPPLPAGAPIRWAEAACRNEIAILQQEGTYSVRYRERKVDSKGDTTRVVIESKEGGVARLVERNGQPITAAQDAAERARLQDALDHPDDFLKHHRRDAGTRHDVIQVLEAMPKAMVLAYTPGQPQLPGVQTRQVVLDFTPDPNFHPPTMMSELLTGLAGRVWIDAETQHVTRIEGHVLRPVNFGFGLVARLYPGGTMEFQQASAGGHWMYSQIDEHLMVRALLVKTVPQNLRMTSSDVEVLPGLLRYQDAIRQLLAMPTATR